jgi:hypothetical protein
MRKDRIEMPGDEKRRRRQRNDDDAYSRLGPGDPGVGLDNLSTLRSVGRFTDALLDLGGLIARRLRERVANRRSKGS